MESMDSKRWQGCMYSGHILDCVYSSTSFCPTHLLPRPHPTPPTSSGNSTGEPVIQERQIRINPLPHKRDSGNGMDWIPADSELGEQEDEEEEEEEEEEEPIDIGKCGGVCGAAVLCEVTSNACWAFLIVRACIITPHMCYCTPQVLLHSTCVITPRKCYCTPHVLLHPTSVTALHVCYYTPQVLLHSTCVITPPKCYCTP